jgi:U6 snRNA-associated Sm-like protein LSm7
MSKEKTPYKNSGTSAPPPPKKESILELNRLIDAKVHVKCLGGREVVGTLKGYDELVNLVLDDTEEYLRGEICFLEPLLLL